MNYVQEILDKVEGIIFDCDGTLVDSMPLHMKAWEHAFIKHDEKYDESFLFSLKGMKETDIILAYNSEFKTKLIPEKIVLDKHLFFLENIEKVKPVKSIVEIAKENYSKKPMAVVSGSVADIVHKELKIIGIYNLFDTIITANDPFKPKPNPECFIEASRRIKVNPEKIVVFEDGDPGIEAAKNAGMLTVDVRTFAP